MSIRTPIPVAVDGDKYDSVSEQALIEHLVQQYGSPLLILDCDAVRRQYRALHAALPGVTLHYALKPLPHPAVVSALMDEGASFDLATSGEVDLVAGLGVDPQRCIHTHPIKRDRDIRDALDFGCTTFVADNPDELLKFVAYRDQAELLLRVSFRSPDARIDLSKKFGCSPQGAKQLLAMAADLGVRVRGLSFHVGSQALDPGKYVEAINACRELMVFAEQAGLPALEVLDIGGGFPVDYVDEVTPIGQFCAPIRAALEQLPESVRVLAEPGRYIVAPAVTAVASVMGKARRDGRWWYYLDDGLYGAYSGVLFDHGKYPVDCLYWQGERFPSVLAGPTCDSIDVIDEEILLPELAVGDLIIGRAMGAYTWATATEFNFFPKPQVVVINEYPQEQQEVLALVG